MRIYHPHDFERFRVRPEDRELAESLDLRETFATYPEGTLFTIETPKGPVFAGTRSIYATPGVAEVFLVPSDGAVASAPRVVLKGAREVEELLFSQGHWRLQTVSVGDQDKWMRLLGYTCEGVMRAYTIYRADCKMYAKVRL